MKKLTEVVLEKLSKKQENFNEKRAGMFNDLVKARASNDRFKMEKIEKDINELDKMGREMGFIK